MSAALPPVMSAPPSYRQQPIRLPSYKELAALSECDLDAPIPRANPSSSLFTKGLIHLPPLKVPSRPLSSKDHDNGPRAHDRFLDLARHCPVAPPPAQDEKWSPYSAYRPSPTRHTSSGSLSTSPQPTSSPIASLASASQSHSHTHPLSPAVPVPIHSHYQSPHPSLSPIATTTNSHAYSPLDMDMDSNSTSRLKFSHATAKAGGRAKKQALSCYFCRERKIACGRPEDGTLDGRCNQCARRKIACTYPTVSHRGQHSRLKSAARKALGDPGHIASEGNNNNSNNNAGGGNRDSTPTSSSPSSGSHSPQHYSTTTSPNGAVPLHHPHNQYHPQMDARYRSDRDRALLS
ncbi:hypothetical protein C8F01DRAFT_770484 [Mycena amicta]|nr:hypothetical protein C8F01DRAFT_770484 [Mycena amicta]